MRTLRDPAPGAPPVPEHRVHGQPKGSSSNPFDRIPRPTRPVRFGSRIGDSQPVVMRPPTSPLQPPPRSHQRAVLRGPLLRAVHSPLETAIIYGGLAKGDAEHAAADYHR